MTPEQPVSWVSPEPRVTIYPEVTVLFSATSHVITVIVSATQYLQAVNNAEPEGGGVWRSLATVP